MNITINHHHYYHPDPNKEVIDKLNFIIQQNKKEMGQNQEQFDALMSRLDTVTNDVAEDYKNLLAEVQDKISPESLARAEANIAKLEALGASVENPVPTSTEGGEAVEL